MTVISKENYNSAYQDWQTPPELIGAVLKAINKDHFNMDVCCTQRNVPAKNYLTVKEDGLTVEWDGTCWMNPPYGRMLQQFVRKAYSEAYIERFYGYCSVVGLLPVRTDNVYYHKYVLTADGVYFLQGKNFEFLIDGKKNNGEFKNAPQKLCLVFWGFHPSHMPKYAKKLKKQGLTRTMMMKTKLQRRIPLKANNIIASVFEQVVNSEDGSDIDVSKLPALTEGEINYIIKKAESEECK